MRALSLILAASVAIPLTTVAGAAAATSPSAVDILHGHDWAHLSGATPADDGVHVTPLGRQIVNVDGNGYQADPPVNLRGPHLKLSGDFRVDATLSGVTAKAAYVQLYEQVPIIYDEWRQERRSVRLGVVGGAVQVAVFDGKQDGPRTTKTFGSGYTGAVTVSLATNGTSLQVYANGKSLGTVSNPGVFGTGTSVWFGLDAALGGGFTLSGLTASGAVTVADAPPLAQPAPGDSLRTRASALHRPILIGTAAATDPLFTESAYRQLLAGQFSMVTPENDMKPQFVHPQPGVYDFAEGDGLVDFANANGMKVHAHTLVWQEALPKWMKELPTSQAKAAMLDHIDHVAGHYAGRVAEWDVVNEPIDDDTNKVRTNTVWYKAMGASYIDLAFTEAHRADPQAALYLNEYGIEADGPRWDFALSLVKGLLARGVPINGVGFQNHEYEKGDRTNPAVLAKHVKTLAALGLQVRFSEMDVLVNSTSEEQIQATELAGKLAVCVQAPNCTSFSTWGFTDRYGSTADTGHYPPTPGDALPWDANYQPKKAYTAMLGVLTPSE